MSKALYDYNRYENYTIELKNDSDWGSPVVVSVEYLYNMFKAKMEDEENGRG